MELGVFEIDIEKEKNSYEKMLNLFYLMNFWMELMEDDEKISDFFVKRNYSNVAIYGMGYLGKHLKKQLEKEGMTVLYTVDKNKIDYKDNFFPLTSGISEIPKPDVIVITPVMEYKSIKKTLSDMISTSIISIEEVILSL